MKREEILSEMKAALERYRTIEEDQFYFGAFVNKYDAANNCGTICCLWGWEPKFKVLPVKWINNTYSLSINNKSFISLSKEPSDVFNWGKILNYLYYPSNENLSYPYNETPDKFTGFFLWQYSSLNYVLTAWSKVIELIETTDKLDQFLNLDEE